MPYVFNLNPMYRQDKFMEDVLDELKYHGVVRKISVLEEIKHKLTVELVLVK